MDLNPESLEEEVRHDKVVNNEVLIGTLGIIILVLLGVIGYLALRTHVPSPGGENAQTATSTVLGNDPGKIVEHATYYDISAAYPVTTPLASLSDAQPNARAVNAMKQYVLDQIAQFKSQGNFDHLTHDDIQMMQLDQRKELLNITYRQASGNGDVSYVFTMSEDTLGAHPNTTYKTFVFDGKTGTQLSIKDLFAPGADYLVTLSMKTRALLPAIIAKSEGVSQKSIDTNMMLSGTTAAEENFADWYVEGTDLVIIFAPYQVAPYAAGPQTVRIPIAQLGGAKATNANTRVNDFGTLY